jgi:hypothetical protein
VSVVFTASVQEPTRDVAVVYFLLVASIANSRTMSRENRFEYLYVHQTIVHLHCKQELESNNLVFFGILSMLQSQLNSKQILDKITRFYTVVG